MTDIAASTPSVPIPTESVPNWKRLVSIMADDTSLSEAREQVLSAVTERVRDFPHLEAQLADLRGMNPDSQPTHSPSGAAIHASLATLLQECLSPAPPAARCSRDPAASHWWCITKSLLQKIRRLRQSIPATANRRPFQRTIILEIFNSWKKAERLSPAPSASLPALLPLPVRLSHNCRSDWARDQNIAPLHSSRFCPMTSA